MDIKRIAIISLMVVLLAVGAVIVVLDRNSQNGTDEMLSQAGFFYENYDYDNAIAIYNEIIISDSGCTEAFLGLADAYYAKGNNNKAVQILEKASLSARDTKAVERKLNSLFPDGIDNIDVIDETNNIPDNTEDITETSAVTEVTFVTEADVTEVSETDVSETEVPETETEVSETASAVTEAATANPVTTTAVTAAQSAVTVKTTVKTTVTTTEKPVVYVNVKDLTEMNVNDAAAWCEAHGLGVKLMGSGDVVLSQSPAPGSEIAEGDSVIIKS